MGREPKQPANQDGAARGTSACEIPRNGRREASSLRPPPPRRPRLALGAEPPLPLRRVDARLRVRRRARHVVDARALPADIPLDAAIAHTARSRGLEPLPAAPARRHDELTSPHTPAGRLRRRLVRDVVRRLLAVDQGPPLRNPGSKTAHWTDAPRMGCTSTKLTGI